MSNFLERIGQDKIEDREEIEALHQQLAECQAANGKLRGFVERYLAENDTTEFGCTCHPGEGYICGTCRTFDRQLPLRQALALPNDATALNELIAERTRIIKEEFERECNDVDWLLNRLCFAGDNFRTDGGSLRLQMLVELFEQFIAERTASLTAEVERLKAALTPKPPRDDLVPHAYELEATHNNAEFWYRAGHSEEAAAKGESVICMAQAVFAWKNAAYAKAEEAMKLQGQNAELTAQRDGLLAALEEISDDYADRFDLGSQSTNPGIKYVVEQARAAIANCKEPGK